MAERTSQGSCSRLDSEARRSWRGDRTIGAASRTRRGVSFKYREQARPFNLNSENVLEAFYGFAITPFVVLSADLQVIRPMLQGSGTAVLPGVRLVIEF